MKEKQHPAHDLSDGITPKGGSTGHTESPSGHSKRKPDPRQIAAITGIVLLALLYLISLAAAILDSSSSGVWFQASLFGTVALPILIWIYVWLYGKITGRHTIADAPADETEDNTASDR